MHINVLCVGDIVGRPGRTALAAALPDLVREHQVDMVAANAENVAGGSGLTPQSYKKLLHYGVHVITLGDHCYRRREGIPLLDSQDNIVRPANLPTEAAGRGWTVFTTDKGVSVAVVVVVGRMYMKPADCPFHAVDKAVAEARSSSDVVIVEFHAEATSEKIAMGWHLDGRAALVYGTHTHVPTADSRILPKGTAYITDIGMTGPYRSVLGRSTDCVLKSLITGMPVTYNVASEDVRVSSVLVGIDGDTGLADRIELLTTPVEHVAQGSEEQE